MSSSHAVPLIHITDLYHPAQDPDDQFDLATAVALPELELKAVLFDVTRKFLVAAPEGWDVERQPGEAIVAGVETLTGSAIPRAVGPRDPLGSMTDDASDRPESEQGAIALLLQVLAESSEPVAISIVGSVRILAAAVLRAPEMVRERVSAVWVNAGSTTHGELEWNVMLDPMAFRILWDSGLSIHWFPCATEAGAFDPEPERGTHWSATHAELLRDVSPSWRGWFGYGLSGSAREDLPEAMADLRDGEVWAKLDVERRSMWSTASLAMAAGRVLAQTPSGWRFAAERAAHEADWERWPWRLDAISAQPRPDAHVEWATTEPPSRHQLFGRKAGRGYGRAMTEALNALLVSELP